MLEFCDKCDSVLARTKAGKMCQTCDRDLIENLKGTENIPAGFVNSGEFPYEKNQYYSQKDVRKNLRFNKMDGINYKAKGNFIVIFMSASDPKKAKYNPYHDRYDPETGLYHYTGRGKYGDQTLTGANGHLAGSNENNITIHVFKQQNINSDHQYIGIVRLESILQNIQPDANGQNRKVYVFLLKKIEE